MIFIPLSVKIPTYGETALLRGRWKIGNRKLRPVQRKLLGPPSEPKRVIGFLEKMGKRRRAREVALKVLYEMEVARKKPEETLSGFWENYPCKEEVRSFAIKLVTGTIENLSSIDALLREHADNWDIGRMASVDRNILRFASYELLFLDEIPPKVTINEAIEIAKKYSTQDSGRFVNGILDTIKNEKRP